MKKEKRLTISEELRKTNKFLGAILNFLVKYHTPIHQFRKEQREEIIKEIEKQEKEKWDKEQKRLNKLLDKYARYFEWTLDGIPPEEAKKHFKL